MYFYSMSPLSPPLLLYIFSIPPLCLFRSFPLSPPFLLSASSGPLMSAYFAPPSCFLRGRWSCRIRERQVVIIDSILLRWHLLHPFETDD